MISSKIHPNAQTSDGNELFSGGSKQSSGANHRSVPVKTIEN
jgi:hypothetical protein